MLKVIISVRNICSLFLTLGRMNRPEHEESQAVLGCPSPCTALTDNVAMEVSQFPGSVSKQ